MKVTTTAIIQVFGFSSLSYVPVGAQGCSFTHEVPTNADDFGEPYWEEIIKIAFPEWSEPEGGCPQLDKVGGEIVEGTGGDSKPEDGKFNPCYFTKAYAGLDPKLGGYPTPIDTHYPYEFAAPFYKQPGDGSTHHCPVDAAPTTPVQSCPKIKKKCDNGMKDCVEITDEYGIGHVPPFVALSAIKNEYMKCDAATPDICETWFNFNTNGCNILPSIYDELIYKYFGVENRIEFQPPILLDGKPSSTYYKLEYINEGEACADDNCRGPHYCSKEAADADIWGDFCPYVHTGPNSGKYRHPHVALAAFELWFANKCNPEKCPSEWLKTPNAEGYGVPERSTSITWAEMIDNDDPMSQPVVPYEWPNSGSGSYPGHELYGELSMKPVDGVYVTDMVTALNPSSTSGAGHVHHGAAVSFGFLITAMLNYIALM